MFCRTCHHPLFAGEQSVGRCRACVRDEEAAYQLRYNVGGVQFRQFGTEMVLLYHDAFGRITFVAPMEQA